MSSRRAVRRALPDASMAALERAIGMAERGSSGQVRLVVEANWPLLHVNRHTPRSRALEWFSQLHVWDTEHNNGVLIYLLFAERKVEIVADRGFNTCVTAAQWQTICHAMEQRFAHAEFEAGLMEGISAIGALQREHFAADMGANEQPDRPVLV
ncbi:MAG: TPM domain-containing protein [Burkholderiales bacterium]|nr:TPM domain-containing protein [Burkholderiales bacterium]